MNNLITLVKMQLQEKLNFKRIEISKSSIFNFALIALVGVLKFAFVIFICLAFIRVAQMFSLFVYPGVVPQAVMSFIFVIMTAISTVSCTIGLTRALYYSKDNTVLLTLPATPMQTFLSKIIIFYIFELKRSLSFIVPLFLAYFFLHGYAVGYYFWMLLCFLFVPMFTVALGALLSIPCMCVANVFNQHKLLQNICLLLLVLSVGVGLMFAISLIPSNINFFDQIGVIKIQLRDFFDSYAYYNPMATFGEARLARPIYNLTLLLLGTDGFGAFNLGASMIRLLILIGSIAILATAAVFIVKPLFYKMASTPFEYKKKLVGEKCNLVFNKRSASVVHEFRIALKTPQRMFSNIGILISVPVLIMFLNKVFAAMNASELGEFMIVAFNVLIILLVILNSNVYASSIYSREGRSSYLIKTQPTRPIYLILSKLVPNSAFITLSLIITAIIVNDLTSVKGFDVVMLFLGIYFVYLTHLLLCAESDLMNPKTEIYASVGNDESNPNETRSTAFAFGASFAIAVILMLLLMMHERYNLYLRFMIVATLVFARKLYVFIRKVTLYYKEK